MEYIAFLINFTLPSFLPIAFFKKSSSVEKSLRLLMDTTDHNTKEILKAHRNHNGNIGNLKLLIIS